MPFRPPTTYTGHQLCNNTFPVATLIEEHLRNASTASILRSGVKDRQGARRCTLHVGEVSCKAWRDACSWLDPQHVARTPSISARRKDNTHLYEGDVGPLVTAAGLVERKEVRHRSLQELGVELVADVVNNDYGGLSNEWLFLRVEAENSPEYCTI